MMRRFVSNNVIFFFLVIIITIDASRIFYIPLPKIHSSQQELKSSPNTEESEKKTHEKRSISNKFIPLSAMERYMYDEQEESEKPDTIDWESFLDKKAVRHHITVNELSPGDRRHLNHPASSNLDKRKSNKNTVNDIDPDDAIDQLAQVNVNHALNEPWMADHAAVQAARLQANGFETGVEQKQRRNDIIFLVLVSVCSLIGILGLISAAIFWYKIQKRAEAALDAEYPSYGVTGPNNSGTKISPSSTMSDRKLAQSAQMFHYQQQRQQMMAQEKAHLDAKPVHSDDSDDEAPGGGDYTVYECPGLAPTGEMEVRNPLFTEPDPSLGTSALGSHPTTNNHYPQPTTASPSSSPPKEKLLS